jgi:acyl-CoA thioesterase
MEFDEQKIKDLFKNDRFAAENGVTLEKAAPGYAEAKIEITEKHLNGLGSVMGGAIFTLADFAFAAASNSKGFATVSCSSSINFFCAPKGKTIKAKATEVFSSRKLCTYNVDIFDAENNFVARYVGNGYILKTKTL